MPTWNKVSDETRVAIWRAWKEEKLTYKKLRMRFKVSNPTISRAIATERMKRHVKTVIVTPAPAPTTTAIVLHHNGRGRGVAATTGNLREEILALRAQGLTLAQVSEKLNVSHSTVSRHLYQYGKKNPTGRSSNEGAITNGQLNKNVAVGIVYAEVERFLSALSQRLGVSTTILRPRLSELLGHSPFR